MSDVRELDAAGLPEELSAVDQLLHRGEANPRTRSGIMGVELLDSTPIRITPSRLCWRAARR